MDKYLIKNGTLLSILDGSAQDADILVEDGIIVRIDKGSFNYLDSKKENREFSEKATAVYTCLGSKVYLCWT